MIDFDDFYAALESTPLQPELARWRAAIEQRYHQRIHGDHHKWQQAYTQLPHITTDHIELDADTVSAGRQQPVDAATRQQLENALQGLHPWRKGPFRLFDTLIDTEWRSDWKWQRLAPHISPLQDRLVLDVGCGSGYHCWRMAGAGARLVIGIDPSQKFLFQFHAIKKYLGPLPVFYLPLRAEDLPARLGRFDTVFSMGVLYHRQSPFAHLEELHQAMRPGGELVLETLVIEGGRNEMLLPGERYAQMRNVWFLPSCDELLHWLHRAGFVEPRLVDVNQTSCAEQRSTDWMRFHSLRDFLDPHNPEKTVEGYPAPRRGTFIARKATRP
jgi:tRNA (mo5U34)-methyltransferase